MKESFRISAERAAAMVGSHWAFVIASFTVGAWAITGPYFHYSDTWQLFINTGTTIVTFLMVFLIQNTQNRETRIVGLKLDELLRGVEEPAPASSTSTACPTTNWPTSSRNSRGSGTNTPLSSTTTWPL